jgi:plastocyanin
MRKGLAVGWRILGLLIIFLWVAACAGLQQKPMVLEPGEQTLALKVDSFSFEPNSIKTRQGAVLTIQVKNVSGMEHNLTIKSPQGNILVNVNIPAKGTAEAKVDLGQPGTYPFYCDKPFHSIMGMKGQIEVSGP